MTKALSGGLFPLLAASVLLVAVPAQGPATPIAGLLSATNAVEAILGPN